MTVTETIITKLAILEWHYVVFNIMSHQKKPRNMGSKGSPEIWEVKVEILLCTLTLKCHWATFHKHLSENNYYTEFDLNLNMLSPVGHGQADEHGLLFL
jgi:hypothetical protein